MVRQDFFKHERLSSKPSAFRTATLFPEKEGDSTIRCEVTEALLDKNDEDNKDPKTHKITLNDKPFEIVESAYCLLERLREFFKCPVNIWVDLLCIDQGWDEEGENEEDKKERERRIKEEKWRQVSLMGRIYAQSQKGVIWLGNSGGDFANTAITLLREFNNDQHMGLGHHFSQTGEQFRVKPESEPKFTRLEDWSMLLGGDESGSFRNMFLEKVNDALITERSKNQEIRNLLWGEGFDPLMKFEEVVTPMIITRQAYHGGKESRQILTLPLLRQRFAASDASRKQDLFYGLLGMAHWEKEPPLKPNYKIPAMQAIREAVVCCIKESGDFSFLFGMRRRNNFMSGDPSWLPDYHVQATPSRLAWGEGQRFKIIKSLGDQSRKGCPPSPESRLLGHGTLILVAVKVDTISEAWAVCDLLYEQSKAPGVLLDWISKTVGLLHQWPTDVTKLGGEIGDKVWRALINNCIPCGDGYRPPTQQDYDDIIKLSGNISELSNDLKDAALKHTPGLAYHFIVCLWRRRMIKTEKGWIGLAPEDATKGDGIWVPRGSSIPFIFRPCCEQTAYSVIGSPFLQDLQIYGYTNEGFRKVRLH
ncbi:hypothetical protein BO94DRAFT_591047 [Aspergillus sclerotioniger CBS 115572]|uniref:Heterokaryon incompatibility domain-containing protein n=1 Tax=Aspergillus sclerotioniger CBS 115572 TaxID=1450535 RepID=A0A317V202_9EURO|nr:hypothetical protein BO94DRAFT_591047 [Aspergillus sclerotioniger CBS 115572]PWY66792.1 hypothetical protein BO94DRAFT_591047 [Aspergillus sclerotioniger CBS 115572]